jgi:hypothetical protein
MQRVFVSNEAFSFGEDKHLRFLHFQPSPTPTFKRWRRLKNYVSEVFSTVPTLAIAKIGRCLYKYVGLSVQSYF